MQIDPYLSHCTRVKSKSIKMKDTLKLMFIVSKCELTDETDGLEEFETSYIKVEKFNGHTCARCWAVFDEDEMHDEELCERCFDVVNG